MWAFKKKKVIYRPRKVTEILKSNENDYNDSILFLMFQTFCKCKLSNYI